MSRKYKFGDQDQLYFVSFAVINWIDLFVRNEYKQIMLDSWKHCQLNKGLEIYGWCIMTSHIHMIIGPNSGVRMRCRAVCEWLLAPMFGSVSKQLVFV